MSIHINYPHSKPHDEALQLASNVADQMQQEFDMVCRWEGEVLHFKRTGVNGCLTVNPDKIVVEVNLGFLLMALKPRIEGDIRKFLAQNFD
ncbi:polyhydroxyalkanoic acid system family protein [Chitinimonas sp. BJYL2]|uniref:polyhydroxyalkanoic acid system family protein n=1 Tax=Chitinimonas sp. BJYL2 TaxID=2976696 RepID=UPI0022B2E4DF|nr:polyhydroxyalkanoic acid system family protein [Chitinimonas sp. BJYL2]